jgi:hypothetical protein
MWATYTKSVFRDVLSANVIMNVTGADPGVASDAPPSSYLKKLLEIDREFF